MLENSANAFLPKGTKITPMLRQWLAAKQKAQGAILLFRMGDFYELFGQDAEDAGPILELAITSRDKSKDGPKLAMAGFPHHSSPNYISKLVEAGFKVAVCDQLQDPKEAKGIVDRGITQVITPGTVVSEEGLTPKAPSYLAALYFTENRVGLSLLDITTGEFLATTDSDIKPLREEILRKRPKEILVAYEAGDVDLEALKESFRGIAVEERVLLEGCEKREELIDQNPWFASKSTEAARKAAALCLDYALETQGRIPDHFRVLEGYSLSETLCIDPVTVKHLDLDFGVTKKRKNASLLALMDETKTAMGGRFLRKTLLAPSCDLFKIKSRQNTVETLTLRPDIRVRLTTAFKGVYDLERLLGQVAASRISPRGLLQLQKSLSYLPEFQNVLNEPECESLHTFSGAISDFGLLESELNRALSENAPLSIKDGGAIKKGFDAELDEWIDLSTGGREELALIEQRERQATGIGNLKIKYTRVFGYYLEVSRSHLEKVPEHYRRKQTVANGERYVTEELALLEAKIASAESKRILRETILFEGLKKEVLKETKALQKTAQAMAELDMVCAFAKCAEKYRYTRPKMLPMNEGTLKIERGRHPMIEALLEEEGAFFVHNDCELTTKDNQICLITGPNMGGKSTMMRQVALVQIMAQMGAFVPAEKAELSVCDRIFARVGAYDDLESGRSTFMVEMDETAQILTSATPSSLVIMDEIGRGTSTYDGLSIAWAVCEYLHEQVGARTLFATHYHELTELESLLPRLKNAHVAVSEENGEVVFLYNLEPGCAERSYGIHVAELAGMPSQVVKNAESLLEELESQKKPVVKKAPLPQLDFFGLKQEPKEDPTEGFRAKLKERAGEININDLTPLEAMMELDKLKKWLGQVAS